MLIGSDPTVCFEQLKEAFGPLSVSGVQLKLCDLYRGLVEEGFGLPTSS